MKKIYTLIFIFFAVAVQAQTTYYYAVGPNGPYISTGGYSYTTPGGGITIKNVSDVSTFISAGLIPNDATDVVFDLHESNIVEDPQSIVFTYSGNAKVLIRPAHGTIGTFLKVAPGINQPLLVFDGAKNITLDGRPGSVGTTMGDAKWRIDNEQSAIDCGPTVVFKGGATNVKLSYVQIKGSNASETSGSVVFGTAGSTPNQNNTIEFCKFWPSLGPYANGIYSEPNVANNTNTIKDSYFEDFESSGVVLSGGVGDAYKIESNSFYLTSPSTKRITVIDIHGGLLHYIGKNYIGGTSPLAAGGQMMVTTGGGPSMVGIRVLAASSPNINLWTYIDKNVIENISASNDNSMDPAFYGVWVTGGSVNISENNIGLGNSIDTYGDSYVFFAEGNAETQIYKNYVRNVVGHMNGFYKFSIIKVTAQNDHHIWYNTIDNTCYAENNTNTDAADACTAITYNGTGNSTIEINTLSFANKSTINRAPMSIISIVSGNALVQKNTISSTAGSGTNNGKADVEAGYSYAIYHAGGKMTAANNFISLGNNNIENVRAVEYASQADNNTFVYNTIFVTGTPGANDTESFAFHSLEGITPGILTMKNNIFFNNRTAGVNYSLGANSDDWGIPRISASNNFYVAPDADAFMTYQGAVLKLNDWRSFIIEPYTYSTITAALPASQFFELTNSSDLRIKVNSPTCWYVNGKATPLAGYNNDFEGTTRSAFITSGSTDIGADEFNDQGLTTPPAADIIGTHAVGSSEDFMVNGIKVATVTWTSGLLPTINYLKYFSGTLPPSPPSGGSPEILKAYWDINATGGTNYTYTLKLYFDPATAGTLELNNDASIMKNSGTGWVNKTATVKDYTENSFEIAGETGFSLFTVVDANTVVPVSLQYFNAAKKNNDVVLSWKALSEINHSMYEVQRSSDGVNFFSIKNILPSDNKDYNTEDQNILVRQAGKIFYRLKMISKTGAISYSAISIIDNSNAKLAAIRMSSENPFSDHIDVQFNNTQPTDAQILLYNTEGKLIQSRAAKMPTGNSSVRLSNLQKLAPATYILKVVSGSEKLSTRVIKQ